MTLTLTSFSDRQQLQRQGAGVSPMRSPRARRRAAVPSLVTGRSETFIWRMLPEACLRGLRIDAAAAAFHLHAPLRITARCCCAAGAEERKLARAGVFSVQRLRLSSPGYCITYLLPTTTTATNAALQHPHLLGACARAACLHGSSCVRAGAISESSELVCLINPRLRPRCARQPTYARPSGESSLVS